MKNNRVAKIEEILRENGNVQTAELSKLFNVSDITIHRYLNLLESDGILKRTRGGAVAVPLEPEFRYPKRSLSNIREKEAIAKCVAGLIKEGDTIILDGSTTNISVARQLCGFNDLIVYTMSPYVMNELLGAYGVVLYSSGGLFSREMAHFVGSPFDESLLQLRVDKSVIGASAISREKGITGPYYQLTSIQKRIIECSNTVILAADHTKFDRSAIEKVADIESIDYLVTDSGINSENAAYFGANTNLIIA